MIAQEKTGLRIKELRLESKLSQEKLGLISDIDRTYIAGVENGKRNISIKNISKIADALKISLFDFFHNDIFK
ncbi:helix-turn-helix transcriptional regulator [Tenacibaculum ascidiaceicola]|uniref:helix-turn-helix domain-containing protein n=1 Tax=Tenacibaculum ascidiaceicola TaxID=1699411 RepID=UPI0039E87D40